MGSCLGIYAGNKVIKYAKLTADKDNNISVDSYGTKFISGERRQVIQEIIKETVSTSVPIAINIEEADYSKVEIFRHLSKKDIESVIQLEFEEQANKLGLSDKALTYKYVLGESIQNKDNFSATIITAERKIIEDYTKAEGQNVRGLYPYPYIMNNTVPKNESNYLFISMEEDTNIATVINGEAAELKKIDVGMKDVIEKLAPQLGSYAKAYETCKALNVYTEEENLNNPEIEAIVEPILQDILHRIETELKPVRSKIQKIFITGMGTLFTNIDMLFEQYFGIKSEILKPYFVKDMGGIKNIAELVETNAAISLAHENLFNENKDINFVGESVKKALFNVEATVSKIDKLKQFAFEGDSKKIAEGLIAANIVAGALLALYITFGVIYSSQVKKIQTNVNSKVSQILEQSNIINEDISYIKAQKDMYASTNELVKNTTDKIEGNVITKYTTYNVANFMQKIIKYIPKNVELVSIASNDNKTVTISAKSDSYAGLGYFVSQLKLEGILTNIVTKNVDHGASIVVEIEGVLP